VPGIFDGLLSSCLNYYRTSEQDVYSSLYADTFLTTLCAELGNVVSGALTASGTAGLTSTTTSNPVVVSGPSATPGSGVTKTLPVTGLTTTEPTVSANSVEGVRRVNDPLLGLVLGLVALLIC
jgi:hypothetical protein